MTTPANAIAGRYEVVRSLGRGSFAQTLLARDSECDRVVALKVLHPRRAADWKSFELFEREAAVLRTLRHQGIPAVHDAFRAEWEGAQASFISMEFIEGESLAGHLTSSRHLAIDDMLQVYLEMLGVLDYLHSRVPPILHRDIKPANIILRPGGSPVLVDFGSVRTLFHADEDEGSTMVGTFGYMPYEQLLGRASPSSDLYALAATFLHVVTGRPPSEFFGEEGSINVPRELPGGTAFRNVIARSLLAAPRERFASARDARAALLREPGASTAVVAVPGVNAPVSRAMHGVAPLATYQAPTILETPAPRPLDAQMTDAIKEYSFGMIELFNPDGQEEVLTVGGAIWIGFFSLLTVGVLPLVFWQVASARRKRVRRFFINGALAQATVRSMEREEIEFKSWMMRVRYEFEADGQVHRSSDLVLPTIADRWDTGSTIHVLYIASENYDSVIVCK